MARRTIRVLARSSAVLKGHVEAIEALGSELLVHFSIDATRVSGESKKEYEGERLLGAAIDIVGEGVARVEPRSNVRSGEDALFTVFADRLHFFDPESQNALH